LSRLLRRSAVAGLVVVLVVVAVFVWGWFQPKPPGFAPTDPDEGAFVTDEWTRYTIDATSREEWAFFDFDQGRAVDSELSAPDWDVAFRRTDLVTNSGVTNPEGPGGAVDLGDVALESAAVPSSVVFAVDEFAGEDGDEPENPEISDWYDYSFITHTVHAEDRTYLVRTGDDRDALVQFDSYYCDDEDPGCITFRYRLVPAVESG
jgi:hypothetical protein